MEEADFVSLKISPCRAEKNCSTLSPARKSSIFLTVSSPRRKGSPQRSSFPLPRTGRGGQTLMDVVLYPDIHAFEPIPRLLSGQGENYKRHLKIGGIKLILRSPKAERHGCEVPISTSGKPESDGYAAIHP
ncbi:MAG: hypothetical protein ACLRSW_06710 [Christensenellaceae bacterium]